MANTYSKYCPNVFVAKCDEAHKRGELIDVETKYGKVNECQVWNLVMQRDGFYYYSITRADGFNSQQRAQDRADKLRGWAQGHNDKADACYNASHNAVKDIPFGQPILVGHHSERAHRRAIETSARNMERMCEEMHKAEALESKAKYWEKKAGKIDLSMPESVEYFAYQLEVAKEYRDGVKSGKYPRAHAYTLTYATKNVKELEDKYNTAVKLWGNN